MHNSRTTLLLGASLLAITITTTIAAAATASASAASPSVATACAAFSDDLDQPYWEEVKNCSSCAATAGCGYCMSTLRCVAGDPLGPIDGTPCPDWAFEAPKCPLLPTCHAQTNCNTCAGAEDCAWCASEKRCLTISEIFSENCRGTVFDLPCPASFVGVNRVVGNLVVEQDAVFGGGHLRVGGNVTDATGNVQTYGLVVDDTTATLTSTDDVSILAGDNSGIDKQGGDVILRAGHGTSVNRGRGGTGACGSGRVAVARRG